MNFDSLELIVTAIILPLVTLMAWLLRVTTKALISLTKRLVEKEETLNQILDSINTKLDEILKSL